ncbi:unnamed protein product [Ectocarpus sp. 6 AP-2014]
MSYDNPTKTTNTLYARQARETNWAGEMAQRGRGCLEIRDSSNPFFTTTNSRIGNSACQKHEYDAPPVFRKVPKVDPVAAGIDWSFMYTRESDRIGTGVPPSDSKLGAVVGRRESLGQRARERDSEAPVMYEREEETGVPLRDATCFDLKNRVPEDKDARDELLKNFKHTSKKENPLYSTTNNDIGIKRPTGATFTFERRARQQGFSNSFNGLKFRDMGLNTNVTRSNIHDDLNPQFM